MTNPDSVEESGTPEDSVTTKERLLAVTLSILHEEGANGLTIRKIAERAGVSVSVVHHHYINKQGLVDACKTHFYQGVGAAIADVIAQAPTTPVAISIERAIRTLWKYGRDNVAVLRVLASDASADGQIIDQYRSYDARPFLAMATSVLAPKLGLSEKTARARVHALGIMLTRFAISSDSELASLFGEEGAQAVHDAENELVEMAKLVLVGRPPEPA